MEGAARARDAAVTAAAPSGDRLRAPASLERSAAGRALQDARRAAPGWAARGVRQRLRVLGQLRRRLGADPLGLAQTAGASPWRSSAAETLTAEVLPLLDACRFLEREARRLLAPRRQGWRGRPPWLFGSALEIRRDPLGVVLLIGPSNYPILLAGVQALQALAAGNAVLIKPGRGGLEAMRALARGLAEAGLPDGVLRVLPEGVEQATEALEAGVDKVILTGSRTTGRRVLERLADRATPAVMELSGCDAAVVMAGADLDLAARGIAFGLSLNGGFTCIAPRRLLVWKEIASDFAAALAVRLEERPAASVPRGARERLERAVGDALRGGGRLIAGDAPTAARAPGEDAGGFRPVVLGGVAEALALDFAEIPAPSAALFAVGDEAEALERIAGCPCRLGVSIFGPPRAALALARRADAGVAIVNDVIVPSADPRAPFGGRGASGFGVTRGAEGLLEMTAIKTVIERRGRSRVHYDPIDERDTPLFESLIRLLHGPGGAPRLGALRQLAEAGRQRGRRQS